MSSTELGRSSLICLRKGGKMGDSKEIHQGSHQTLPESQTFMAPASSMGGLPMSLVTHSLSTDVGAITTRNTGSVPAVHPSERKAPSVCLPEVVYPPNYDQADGGHGWLVLLSAFLVYFVSGGIFATCGIILPYLISGFDADRVIITMLPSVQVGLCLTSGLFAGPLVELYGCRLVCIVGTIMAAFGYMVSSFITNIWLFFFTYSIIPGIGLGLQYIPAVIIVQEWFDKRRSIATGVQSSGSGVGGFVFPFLTRALLDSYGWRGTILLLGAALFNVVPVAIFFAPGPLNMTRNRTTTVDGNGEKHPHHKSKKNSIVKEIILAFKDLVSDLFDFSVLKELPCLVVLLSVFLYSLGYHIPYIFLPLKGNLIGCSPMKTAMFISILGSSDVVGRLSAGWIGNFNFVNRLTFFSSGMMIAGLSAFASSFFSLYAALAFFTSAFGFGCGVYFAMQAPCLVDLLGMEKLARAFGLLQMASGVASLGAPPMAALILKYSENINLPFMISGGVMIFGSGILLIYNWIAKPVTKFHKEGVGGEEEVKLNAPQILIDSAHERLNATHIVSTNSIFKRRGFQSARNLDSSAHFGSSRWFMSVRGLEGVRPDGVSRDDHPRKGKRPTPRAYLPGALGSTVTINSSRYFSSMYIEDTVQSLSNSKIGSGRI